MSDKGPSPEILRDAEMGGVQRVRKAYEQVYDQLRAMILTGQLPQGHRLPTEGRLATRFGVSRSTIREALRLLAAESLIRTTKGASGGSFVTLPTVAHVSQFLEQNIELLSLTDHVTLPDFLEARELIEVFAVRLATARRSAADLEALRATLVPSDSLLSPEEQYLHNKDFHSVLVDACGNTLLQIAAEPIFFVLHTRLSRYTLPPEFPRQVCAEHSQILEAIEAGDPDEAEQRMRTHLAELGKIYAGIWRSAPSTSQSAARSTALPAIAG